LALESNETNGRAGAHGTLPSPERLSDLIGSIYDCALDPTMWEPVLETIGREFFFSSAMMGVARPVDYRWMFDRDLHLAEFEIVQRDHALVEARYSLGRGTTDAKVADSIPQRNAGQRHDRDADSQC
jgi:hypothetical protein